ncbi:MAG: hypothetical protein OSA43_11695, partial [Pirellulales bacterium]|nr:hypothetical protein [Pirellulales bacterium]
LNSSSDVFSQSIYRALDVTIRRVGWRLSEKSLNAGAYKMRQELCLQTWGEHHGKPDLSLRKITSAAAGAVHTRKDYDRHLAFFLDNLEWYEHETGATHIYDQLVPAVMDTASVIFSKGADTQYTAVERFKNATLSESDPDAANAWCLAPQFLATQENTVGRSLRAVYTPSLDFLASPRYRP